MSNDLIPVAYALTETAAFIEAMAVTREVAAVSEQAAALLLESDQAVLNHWAILWAVKRNLPEGMHPDVYVADARNYLAANLDELAVFVDRIEDRLREVDGGTEHRG